MMLRISTAQSDPVLRNSTLIRPRLNVLINTMTKAQTNKSPIHWAVFLDGSCGRIERIAIPERSRAADYSGLMWATRITLPHLSVSSAISLPASLREGSLNKG